MNAPPPDTPPESSSPDAPPVLFARGMSKSFAGVTVLEEVPFDVRPGEVHTILGENGAGKSTLLKIMAGVHRPDSGTLRVDGADVEIPSPMSARRHGIALIHQEPLSFPDLSVAENIFLGHEVPRGRLGQIDWRAMRTEARRLLSELGVPLDPAAKLRGLSIADQQMVELAAALSQNARVLLMDEPTASLTPSEVERLFAIVRRLRQEGVAIVFISHRLPEVFEISDRITVLRDGRYVGTRQVGQTTPDEIIHMMVGRELGAMYEKAQATPGEPLLEVKGLSRRGEFEDIDLTLRAGEIVGLAGLVGAGRTEVARAIFGVTRADAGQVRLDGKPVAIRSARDAVRLGLAYVPEDRQQHGLVLPMSIAGNTSLSDLGSVSTAGWLRPRREREVATTWARQLQTRLRSIAQPARELSGGNQQKVVLGKWLQTQPRVLILDEPTRGIDIGAKAEVHHLMAELARQGKAVLMISSDLPEVLAMSDRVLVMSEGRLAGEFTRGQATQENVMAAATGHLEAHREAQRKNTEAQPEAESTAPGAGRWSRWLQHWTRFREVGIAAFVLVAFLACVLIEPRFLRPDNLRSVLLFIPLITVIAMGQMMVIISRNIDLSVGSMLGFAAIVVGNLYIDFPAMPVWLAAIAAALVGAVMGLANGVLVALLRVPAIIATLGTLTAYRGLIFIYSGGRQVDNNDLPAELISLSRASPLRLPWIGSVPWIIIAAAAVALAAWLWLRYTRTGREVYAIGSNPAAAQLRGIPIRRVLLLIFTLTGFLSGVAGLMFASRFGYVNPVSTGQAMELVVISAVVIGGVNVFGGSGSVLGVLLGCLLLGLVSVALPILGVSAFWQLALYGAAILAAALVDTLVQHRNEAAGGVT